MTPQYVDGASGMQKGIASAETGIKVSSVRQRFENPKMYSMDETGTHDGFATNFNSVSTLTVEGEVSGSLATVAPSFNTDVAIANQIAALAGITIGDVYLDDCEVTEIREGFKSFTGNYSSHPEITDA